MIIAELKHILLVISLSIFFNGCNFFKNKNQKSLILQINAIKEFASKADQLWNSPLPNDILDLKSEKSCQFLNDIPEHIGLDFFKCNPLLIECYINSVIESKKYALDFELLKPKKKNKLENFEYLEKKLAKLNHLPILKENYYLNLRQLGKEKIDLTLNFAMSCKEKTLPQKSYLAFQDNREHFVWDNYNRNINIDEYYVNNLDFYLFKNEKINLNSKDHIQKLYTPYLYASVPLMHQFCESRGKKLLKTHFAIAASMVPTELNDNFALKLFDYPYLNVRSKSSKLFNEEEYKFEKKDCLQNYFLECNSILKEPAHYQSHSTSWMNVKYLFGDYLAYYYNEINPNQNLFLGSRYLSRLNTSYKIGTFFELIYGEDANKKYFEEFKMDHRKFNKDEEDYFIKFNENKFFPKMFRCAVEY